MVARAEALENYDPSLYLRAPQATRADSEGACGRAASGKRVAGGYGPAEPAVSVDGADWPAGVGRAAPVVGKFRYSRPGRDRSRNR
jgi:hypothetical protein